MRRFILGGGHLPQQVKKPSDAEIKERIAFIDQKISECTFILLQVSMEQRQMLLELPEHMKGEVYRADRH